MSLKTTAKILFTLTSIEIILFLTALTPVRGQNIFASIPVSQESIETATDLFQQGQAKAKQLNYRGAIADFSRAIQLNPNEADFYYQRGLILRQLSDREAAIRDFDDAILRNPKHAWAYLQRAGVAFNFQSGDRITNYRASTYPITNRDRSDARAILDLRTARDLFAQQGDQTGFQTADKLIQHFAGSLESEASPRF